MSRFRLAILATILTVAALGIVSLLAVLSGKESRTFDHLVGWAIISAMAVALITVSSSLWGRSSRASSAIGSDPQRVEVELSRMLAAEADARHPWLLGRGDRNHLLNLRFDKVTSLYRDYGGRACGDLVSVAEFFRSLSPGRLVVLGGAGSGKSVLAVELQVQLLQSRSQNQADPLPVLANAASYDPGETWARWLVDHLAHRYVLPERAIAQLVADGRILPIIDGVDALERVAATRLLAELNVFVRERGSTRGGQRPPVVITCREAEYQDFAEPLDGATHVEVRSLTAEEVRSYLRESGSEVPDALAPVLASPLMLSLADTIYGTGAKGGQPVDELLCLPDETAVERQLLASFVACAYRRTRRSRTWSLAQAERWLALISGQMRALSTDGYAWRHVACAMPSGRLGLLGGGVTGLGLLVSFTVLGITHHVFGERMPLASAIESLAVLSIGGAGLAVLVIAGVDSGWLLPLPLVVSHIDVPSPATISSLSSPRTSPMASREVRSRLLCQQQGEAIRAATPRADLIQSRTRAVISAAAVGMTLGVLAVALFFVGLSVPRDATIVFVCYCMVLTVLCTSWGLFQLARPWFSVRRELPYRLLRFLDDAHERGILRPAGPWFEFRDNAVRGYFSDPVRLPGVRQEIGELSRWALGNPEISEMYRYVGASRSDIEQAVSSLAAETILAGKPFTADAGTRQVALERVRVRLNELSRRSTFEEFLVAREAPGLGMIPDPPRVILTKAMDDLARLIDRFPSAAVGISGIRGIGKSTLIRWLCTERNTSHQLGIYVSAPVEYDTREFLAYLYLRLCKRVLDDDRFTGRWTRLFWYLRRVALAVVLAVAGIGIHYHHSVVRMAIQAPGEPWFLVSSVFFAAAVLFILVPIVRLILVPMVRRIRRRRSSGRSNSLRATAEDMYRRLRYQLVETTGRTGSLSGPFGLSFSGSWSRQAIENRMTLPELVESYREFAARTVSALQDYARPSGPLAVAQVRLVVGIDEIDRIEDAGNAEKFLNDIKAIFGIPNCFYIASLSADALANFERRVVSTRTAFDTTFDTVVRIGPLELDTARQVLERRAIGLPYPFITLCYVLSGGVPRELMRIARSIFDIRNDARFGSAGEGDEGAVPCAVIAPRVITREMESLRQGLMSLATQLSVPGAADLIGLLDDPGWPSGNMPDDMAKLTQVIGQRSLFQDENGAIAAAAKVCDGLAAASYFFLTVDELFRTRLDRVVADLKRYDASLNRDPDLASPVHLIARARTAIGVNPALAVTRIRASRKDYGLPDTVPVLLSQLPLDSAGNSPS